MRVEKILQKNIMTTAIVKKAQMNMNITQMKTIMQWSRLQKLQMKL